MDDPRDPKSSAGKSARELDARRLPESAFRFAAASADDCAVAGWIARLDLSQAIDDRADFAVVSDLDQLLHVLFIALRDDRIAGDVSAGLAWRARTGNRVATRAANHRDFPDTIDRYSLHYRISG